MKLRPQAIDGFLRKPPPAIHTALIYGPDAGLVTERARQLQKTWLSDPDDPFALSELRMETLQSEPERLAEEMQAMTLTGGDRVVNVRGPNERLVAAVKQILALTHPCARCIIEAGDLAANSKLRKLVEASEHGAAIPCYRDDDRDVQRLIQTHLRSHNLPVEQGVIEYLVENLGQDRAVTRNELDKLALYAGPDRSQPLTLAEVANAVGDSSEIGLDQLTRAMLDGNLADLNAALDRLLGEAVSPIAMIRAAARITHQLWGLRLKVEAGGPIDGVVDAHRPPIHFRAKPTFKRALRHWRSAAVANAIEILVELELACKTSGLDDQAMLRRRFWEIAQLPGQGAKAVN